MFFMDARHHSRKEILGSEHLDNIPHIENEKRPIQQNQIESFRFPTKCGGDCGTDTEQDIHIISRHNTDHTRGIDKTSYVRYIELVWFG